MPGSFELTGTVIRLAVSLYTDLSKLISSLAPDLLNQQERRAGLIYASLARAKKKMMIPFSPTVMELQMMPSTRRTHRSIASQMT